MFPDVALTTDEKARYVQLAHGLVRDTLQEYDVYNGAQQRQVSKVRWKLVKSRENIAVYKDRAFDSKDYLSNVHRGLASGHDLGPGFSSGTSSLSQRNSSSSSSSSLSAVMLDSIPAEEWSLPKLLMVGTLSGTLDDVMYGLTTPDVGLILLKAFYAQDEVIDGQVLAQIHGPTPTEPYRFLGLKWLVKGNPPAVNALVTPRDLVLLETTGILDHPTTGERIGYFLMHSVSLLECPELSKKAAVRGRISSCYIFKELSPSVVDVYMKGYVEASGKIADAVAIISATNGLLCCWKAVVCSQSKKLAWALRTKYSEEKRRRTRQSSAAEDIVTRLNQSSDVCGMCSKTFKMYSRVAHCQLCDEAMCSRCRVTMKLGFVQSKSKDLLLKNVTTCKRCILATNQQSTFAIAQQEVMLGRFGALIQSSSSTNDITSNAETSLALTAASDDSFFDMRETKAMHT
uniref:FYVE-type domain-containing protein n=1 Tax=Globisporangium ultimum (strain ATCC 200006 / CBS 805.95 / DAOM BR144) TaxID=431595 RepID=K3WXH3_GLOUD